MVKGNKFASLAPRVEVKATDTYLTKVTYHCGSCRGGLGSCAWKNMQLRADINMQGYYLKQRHNNRLHLCTRSHDYKRGYTEIRHYSGDLVYLVYIQTGVPCGCRGFSTGLTAGISRRWWRNCRVGVATMTITGIVGHNPVRVCSQKAMKHFWGHQSISVGGWS